MEGDMPLVNCPECGRQISMAADSCPQCGHPTRPGAGSSVGPKCYACAAPATTRCQNCGALSCAVHLQPIYVPHGEGGAKELRCASCYSSVQARNPYSWVVGVAVTVLVALATYAITVFQMKC